MKQKIPKVIHYVWISGEPKPESVLKCIESWKKYCPDYEIKEWNKNNFDVNSSEFVKEALECKKYAFVADYVRLYALYHEGGVYMDSDVEVIKPLDKFLKHSVFSGFENAIWLQAAIMGAEKGNEWIKLLLDYYKDRHFIVDGKMNMTTNVDIITALTRIFYDVKLNNTNQELKNDVYLYSNDYFCPKNYVTGKIELTENSHAIHHFAGSWLDSKRKRADKFVRKIRNFLKDKLFSKFEVMFFKIHANKFYKKLKKEYKKKYKDLKVN